MVDNIYLQFTKDIVIRQRVGIPMGTNCAVFVANLYCFSYEFEFISQLVNLNKIELLKSFKYTLRFVDDLLSLDNPNFSKYLYRSKLTSGVRGIYPDFLELKIEQDSTHKVTFLDTEIEHVNNRWFTKIYDKREHPPLSSIKQRKYPCPSSFISDTAKFGVITSRLHCFNRICMRREDFIQRANLFLLEFLDKGYSRREVTSYVCRFLKSVPNNNFHIKNIKQFARKLTSR